MTNAEVNAMPWTAALMTTDELFEWLANRREAARAIDIESAELGQWKSCEVDPYGLLGVTSDDVGAKWFVRSPESHGWISEFDLPVNKQQAVLDRAQHKLANARAG
jgi:hypothetical protein